MGYIAAIVTSILWAGNSMLVSIVGRQVGPAVVNRSRLVFAAVLLMIAHWIGTGQPLPLHAGLEHWLWLGASGLVGLVFGDACLFQAYVMIGPRLSTLSMSLVPVASTLIAWLVLGERLSLPVLAGIAVAVAGVMWVVFERSGVTGGGRSVGKQRVLGLIYAAGAIFGQAGGLVLSRRGLEGNFSTLSAVVIRMVSAAVVIWLLALVTGQAMSTLRKMASSRSALTQTAMISLLGPCLGVWLSLVAVQLVPVGIASTLMALTPIFVLLLAWRFDHEVVSPRAIFGTAGALAGVAFIFLVK